MNELQLFNFNGQQVRVVEINDEPYFVAKDVAGVLEYKRTADAIKQHVRDKHKGVCKLPTPGGLQEMTVISEPGLYSLIMKSKAPKAEQFQDWVTEEVLPTIRKHGAYATEQTLEAMLNDPQTMITTLQKLKEEQEARKALETKLNEEKEVRLIAEQRIEELQPKADYTDKILQNKSLVTITQIAKDYGMSGKGMNAKLHELGIQYKQGKTWLLYSKHQKKGWTQSETNVVIDRYGMEKAVMTTKWTQKGRLALYEILKEKGIIPLIEQDDLGE